ncbi:fimbrial protein [Pseudomonas lundensis]|uniref:Fimbrial protein n=1 Tax=Pseudomonas lundensis TaxID=86185 RepID=A0A266N7D6_9PSED|nr:spore coat protein U domain-containing protein [Pseudomonas lundensis]OZY57932.1 fimbrial protein [Pseudomonas lundensis]
MNKQLIALSLLGVLASNAAFAASDRSELTIKGTLTRPPCTLTSNKVLTADFGSLRYDQVDSAPQIDVPITLTCPPNSGLNISVTAATALTDTVGSAGRTNLGYSLFWKNDSTAINVKGTKKNVSNLNGAVDLSMKAKLISRGTLSEGDFSASAVINIDYL